MNDYEIIKWKLPLCNRKLQYCFHQAYEDATTSEAFKKGKAVSEEVIWRLVKNLLHVLLSFLFFSVCLEVPEFLTFGLQFVEGLLHFLRCFFGGTNEGLGGKKL